MNRILYIVGLCLLASVSAVAQCVNCGVGGATTSTGIITACGASNGQLLFDNAGSCAGSGATTDATGDINMMGGALSGVFSVNGNTGVGISSGTLFVDAISTNANLTLGKAPALSIDVLSMNITGQVLWTNSTNSASGPYDLHLSRAGAASLQHGDVDGATATAQTVRVQSVAAGNANVAGANWTLIGSLSNGSGASGDIIIQTGGTGAGSGVQNTAQTAMTIKGASQHVTHAGQTVPTANACVGFALGTGSSDTNGRVAFTSATSCAINFGTAYTNAPFCVVTPGSAQSSVFVTTTTGVLTATFLNANTAMFYHCFGT